MKAFITFSFDGQEYEYDGGLPGEVLDRVHQLLDAHGFWIGGYPEAAANPADDLDEIPAARWEIEHVGGKILQVHGARADGTIRHEDWKRPRIY